MLQLCALVIGILEDTHHGVFTLTEPTYVRTWGLKRGKGTLLEYPPTSVKVLKKCTFQLGKLSLETLWIHKIAVAKHSIS